MAKIACDALLAIDVIKENIKVKTPKEQLEKNLKEAIDFLLELENDLKVWNDLEALEALSPAIRAVMEEFLIRDKDQVRSTIKQARKALEELEKGVKIDYELNIAKRLLRRLASTAIYETRSLLSRGSILRRHS